MQGVVCLSVISMLCSSTQLSIPVVSVSVLQAGLVLVSPVVLTMMLMVGQTLTSTVQRQVVLRQDILNIRIRWRVLSLGQLHKTRKNYFSASALSETTDPYGLKSLVFRTTVLEFQTQVKKMQMVMRLVMTVMKMLMVTFFLTSMTTVLFM